LHAVGQVRKRLTDLTERSYQQSWQQSDQEAVPGRKVKRLRKVAGGLATPLREHHDVVLTGQLLDRVTPQLDEAEGASYGSCGAARRL
jgi:hypothetical protein